MVEPQQVADLINDTVKRDKTPTMDSLANELRVDIASLRAVFRSRPDLRKHLRRAQQHARRKAKERYYEARDAAIADGRFVEYREPQDVGRSRQNPPGRFLPSRKSAHDGPGH
ncbi:hypothetical protein [Ilumatobacter fluminis]|uniref:hypothetical protein n=1 Tax=Ilumatobacter fluminis TaxID=467091 RepID=UPI0032F01377